MALSKFILFGFVFLIIFGKKIQFFSSFFIFIPNYFSKFFRALIAIILKTSIYVKFEFDRYFPFKGLSKVMASKNLTAIRWAHAVNSQKLLDESLNGGNSSLIL